MEVPEWAVGNPGRFPSRGPPPEDEGASSLRNPGRRRRSSDFFSGVERGSEAAVVETSPTTRYRKGSKLSGARSEYSSRPEAVSREKAERHHRPKSERSSRRDRERRRRKSSHGALSHPEDLSGQKRISMASPKEDHTRDWKASKLGRTVGDAAAAAWAARFECVELLEAGISRRDLVDLIRAGKEGPDPLKFNTMDMRQLGLPNRGYLEATVSETEKKVSEKSSGASVASSPRWGKEDSGLGEELLAQKFGSSVKEQRLAFEAYGSAGSPGWARGSSVPSFAFAKRALPPQEELEVSGSNAIGMSEEAEEESFSYVPTSDDEVADPPNIDGTPLFSKKARQPTPSEIRDSPPPPPPREFPGGSLGGPGIPNDVRRLEKYFTRTRDCFEQLVVLGVKMELVDLVVTDEGAGEIDSNRFRLHTEPKSPGTGLRYVRILERLINRYQELCENPGGEEDLAGGKTCVVGRDFVMRFIEELISSEAGFRTPQAVLYAMEFFSIVFGFEPITKEWARCKKLADNYASKRPPRTGADFFHPDFLFYLEQGVKDTSRDYGARAVMGRLRLCAQASVRHNDLLNTPLSEVEWCRTRGTTIVRGLRSKSLKGKTGPRPWVASFMGISQDHDDWLIVLMDLMLTVHGDSWRKHKFFGVKSLEGKYLVLEPPSIQHDALFIKNILKADLEAGREVPLTPEEIGRFRWHGCKATLTTYMQHFGIKSRAIRHAGDWSKKGEAMPDLYLRESQLLVLKGQEECLLRIRKGESLGTLEGKKIEGRGLPAGFEPSTAGEQPDGDNKKSPSEAEVAMVVPEFRSGDLLEAFRDGVYQDEDLLQREVEAEIPEDAVSRMAGDDEEAAESDSGQDSDKSLVEDDDLSSFTIFLVGQGGKGKIHKVGREVGRPFCGSGAKDYATLIADEALDGKASLCLRCFGPVVGEDGCQTLCSHIATNSKGDAVRCGRRCVLSCERVNGLDMRVHSCMLHARQE